MKKLFASVLCVILSLCIQSAAFAIPEWSADFDSMEIGETNVGMPITNENTETSIFEVAEDPLDPENKVLKIDHDGVTDRYMTLTNTGNGVDDFSGITTISFKVCLTDSGYFNMYFRDSVNTANNMTIFTAKDSTFDASGVKQTHELNKWVSVRLVFNLSMGTIALYTDADSGYNGTLSLVGTSTLGDEYKNHTVQATSLRIGPMSKASLIYFDDFSITSSNLSLTENLFISPISVTKTIMDTEDKVSILRPGNLTFSTTVTGAAGTTETATLMFALYGKDGGMKSFASSETQTFALGETKTLSAAMNIASLEEDDYVRAFIMDGSNNIKPLTEAFDLKQQSEIFFRPTTYEVLEDIYENHPNETNHPRLIRTADEFDTLRSYLEGDSVFQSWFEEVEKDAIPRTTTETLPDPTPDARGTILENGSRRAMRNILPMAFMYQMSETEADKAMYADGVWRFARVVCDTSIFPDWNYDTHYLDTAEMAFAVAIAYDWCYDYWSAEQLKIMEDALYNNIIEISLGTFEGRYDYTGLTNSNNWNPVCNGAAITAAAALAHKYPEECAKVISYSVEALEKCLSAYSPDGGYPESPSYWSYGTTYLMWCLSALDSACATSYGIEAAEGLLNTGYFPAYATGPTGNWNFHDGETGYLDTSLSMFFADKYNDKNLAGMRYNFLNNGIYGSAITPNYKDLLFYNPDLINPDFDSSDLDLDSYCQGIQTVFMRGSFTDTNTIFTGLHGGYNSAPHGDMDAGTFILDAEGVRFIDELGTDNYTLPDYFWKGDGLGRSWQYYKKGTEGQNTIMIADDETIPHGQYALADVEITDFKTNSTGSYAVADMTPALGTKAANATRGVFLSDSRSEVIVQDEISFSAPTELYWLAHTQNATITVDDDGKRAVIAKDGKYMAAYLISDNENLVFETMDAEPLLSATYTGDGQKDRSAFKKLYIHAQDVTEFNVAVVFKTISSPTDAPNYSYVYTNIADWSISDDSVSANEN